ncbi:MAG TPA: hypothetical protein VK724_04800 [Bryobacteraceae bacterium]|jgi:hypothetical protein|nr:hypothetical protein [Bryobacteraceae bacterium]
MAARVEPIPQQPIQLPVGSGALPVYRTRSRSQDQDTENIEEFSLNELRRKIRQNRVSFPAQVPTFPKHDRPDLQRKTVQLYFLLGWSCDRIAQRHGLLRQRVQQILSTWKRRAIQMGYIQEIPPAIPTLP